MKTALLGSERSAIPNLTSPTEPALNAVLSRVKTDNREAAVLSAAAVVATYEQSGTVAENTSESSLALSPVDDLPRCGAVAASYLRRILSGQFPFLLPEFIEALSETGKRVTEELLPDLLDAAKKDQSLRTAVCAVIGRRGEWLATLNPEWSFVSGETNPSEWETGSHAGRLHILRHLRVTDPDQAIVLLESTWASEAPDDRIEFVAVLEHGLSSRDEPFLEKALDDRRKEVRQRALDLLLRLSESALIKRMWQGVAPLIRREKSSMLSLRKLLSKPAIEFELPDNCDAAMQRDGIEPKPPQGIGEKTWWLRQMVRCIPPVMWETHSGLSPQQYIEAVDASDLGAALIPAIVEAVKRNKDSRWAKPLAESLLHPAKETGNVAEHWKLVVDTIGAMNESDRETILLKEINRRGNMVEFTRSMMLLHSCSGPWSASLAKGVLNLLRYVTREMALGKIQPYWPGIGDLTALATRIPVSMADEAQLGWPDDGSPMIYMKPIRTVIEILQFRSKMLKEINR